MQNVGGKAFQKEGLGVFVIFTKCVLILHPPIYWIVFLVNEDCCMEIQVLILIMRYTEYYESAYESVFKEMTNR